VDPGQGEPQKRSQDVVGPAGSRRGKCNVPKKMDEVKRREFSIDEKLPGGGERGEGGKAGGSVVATATCAFQRHFDRARCSESPVASEGKNGRIKGGRKVETRCFIHRAKGRLDATNRKKALEKVVQGSERKNNTGGIDWLGAVGEDSEGGVTIGSQIRDNVPKEGYGGNEKKKSVAKVTAFHKKKTVGTTIRKVEIARGINWGVRAKKKV